MISSLTAAENADEAANRFKVKVEAAAIKLGKDGALGICGSQKIHAKSIPVNVADTVVMGVGLPYQHLGIFSDNEKLKG